MLHVIKCNIFDSILDLMSRLVRMKVLNYISMKRTEANLDSVTFRAGNLIILNDI